MKYHGIYVASLHHRWSYMYEHIVIHQNINKNHTLPKVDFLATFFRRQYRSVFNHFNVIGTEATEFVEITQNNGHHAVQDHSRSLLFVPIESTYGLPMCE